MLNNQDFAQSGPKSPAKRRLELVGNVSPKPNATNHPTEFDRATRLLEKTIMKIDGAYAPSTIRAYQADFQDLIRFCNERDESALPTNPQLIVQYICKLVDTGRSSASIRRAIAGIATIHKLNRLKDPTKDPDVLLEMRRMHRKLGRSSKQAKAVTLEILEKLLDATEINMRGIRDRALLLVAYDTLCRRSELAALQIDDLNFIKVNGDTIITILIRRSKTDQESLGRILQLSRRASIALNDWIQQLRSSNGQLFRGINRGNSITPSLGASQINRIYKKIGKAAGLDNKLVQGISGHSMRVGHAQDLVASGTSMPIIMSKGRWSKVDTVMRYVAHIQLTRV
jgi:site-specific recombinase XerD